MSEQEAVVFETFDKVVVICFVRSEIRSPLSIAVLGKLNIFFDTIKPEIETIIFTGTNDVLASGADLREIAEVTAEAAREFALQRVGADEALRIGLIDEIAENPLAAAERFFAASV